MMAEADGVNLATPEQRVTGLYRLVTKPSFYNAFQRALGARRAHRRFFNEWANVDACHDVLDIGCGPGTALNHIRYHRYLGIDSNPHHIAEADARGFKNAQFLVGMAQDLLPSIGQDFDVVIALGFLHHLNDTSVSTVIDALVAHLRPRARAFFLEPVYEPGQHVIARKLKDLDSGQYIRDCDAYQALMQRPGFSLKYQTSNNLLRVPYCHFWGCLTRDS